MKELRSKYKEVISYKTANVYQLPGTYPLFPGGFAQQLRKNGLLINMCPPKYP